MEFASFLAGEPWSDSPQCTDPLLAHLARAVNDLLPDERRGEIAPEIPRVVGLRGDHRVIAPIVAVRAATAALPIAAAGRQTPLAVAILSLSRAIPAGIAPRLRGEADDALAAVPLAADAARGLAAAASRRRDARMAAAGAAVQIATTAIAEACVGDPAAVLVELLRDAIGDVEEVVSAPTDAAPVALRRPESILA
jgi:hypothetical protein